jgi:hypothetical protein
MEFGSGIMTNTPYIICYFNGPFLVACPRVLEIVEPALGSARPPRTPSNVVDTKEEQQMRLEKLGFGDKSKYETNKGKYV